jgi:putative drug exporter of the RND superfamily
MFYTLAKFARKYKYFILIGWLILAAVLTVTAPKLSEVGVTDQSQFLPDNTESAYARDLLNTKFTNIDNSRNSALIVVYNENGLNQQDMDRARTLYDWLTSTNAPEAIDTVTSIFDNDALRSSLISKDNTTMLITVSMSVPALDDIAQRAIEEIRYQFSNLKGTIFYLSGTVGLLYDLFASVQDTIALTTKVTIILVVILLLLVYRSPLAAIVPLAAIGCSYLVARGIVGFIAQAGVSVSTIIDAYLVVTIFGVGTDYCLFIISRFREELGKQDDRNVLSVTLKRIGPILLASATTVVIAFVCLSISQFGMTRSSGWALAIGIIITLLTGLTLVPALMTIFGKNLFWPAHKIQPHRDSRFSWNTIGKWISKHPVQLFIPIIVVLALPYLSLSNFKISANSLAQISENVESARGLNVVREHFPVGELSPLYLLIKSPSGSLLTSDSLTSIEKISSSLKSDPNVLRVGYFSDPADQLSSLSTNVQSIVDLINTGKFNPISLAGLAMIADNLQDIALSYPGILQSQNFNKIITDLTQIQELTNQLLASPTNTATILGQIQISLSDLSISLSALSNEFELAGDTPFVNWLQSTYFSNDGTIVRINLILKTDPYSDAANDSVKQIRTSLTSYLENANMSEATAYLGGDAAIHTDMLATSETDFIHVLILTSLGILLVIIILLRSVLSPLYMVITVLFNFGATMGITSWLFLDVLKETDIVYLLPVFVFVMLAAVGADYNIFLVSRIREESENKTIREAVRNAVANTGGVITSCGIILAGTFATLAISPLPMVMQIGVPIAIGVLIDTFIVRAILVPSLAVLCGRWNWWPSRLFKK